MKNSELHTAKNEPFQLDHSVLTSGMTFDGKVIQKLTVEWAGGRLEATLPEPVATTFTSETQQQILDALSSGPLSRKELARRVGLPAVGGVTRLSSIIEDMLRSRMIVEQGDRRFSIAATEGGRERD